MQQQTPPEKQSQSFFKRYLPVFVAALVAVVVIGTLLIVYYTVLREKPQEGQKLVSLKIEYSDKSYTYMVDTEEDFLLGLMEELNTRDTNFKFKYSGLGENAFMTSFLGCTAPAYTGDNSPFYMLMVDGVASSLGISAVALSDTRVYTVLFAATPAFPDYVLHPYKAD